MGGGGQWQWEEPREWRELMFNLETLKPKGPYIWTQSVELRLRVGEGNKLQILGPSSTIRSFVWIKCALVLVTPS